VSFEDVRKNDEHWRDNLIGCTFSKRLEQAALRRHGIESALTRLDIQKRHLQSLLSGRKVELLPNLHESVMCAVLEPKSKKIVDIGFNVPEDIILDNFGYWLAGIIRPAGVVSTTTLVDVSGASRTVYLFSGVTSYLFNGSAGYNGALVQVGSGSSTPARDDYKIQTAFGTAPENTQFNSGFASYGSGYVSFNGAIIAGGSGTIAETGFLCKWNYRNGSTSQGIFMLFHDVLVDTVGFTVGKLITVSCSVEL